MMYEAGVTGIQYPYDPRWTQDYVEAESVVEAEAKFEAKGYYRNLVVRLKENHGTAS